MPAFTPNYSLPYPVPGDQADVPAALKFLAEEVEGDLRFEEQRSLPRLMAQFLGTIPNTIPTTATSGNFTWQVTDFNTSLSSELSPGSPPAVQPVTDPATNSLTVNYPGFWLIFGTAQARSVPSSANIDELGVEILHNGSATPLNCRSGSHDVTLTAEPTFTVDASCGLFLNAGDTVALRGMVRRSSGSTAVTYGNRSITLLRMTQS